MAPSFQTQKRAGGGAERLATSAEGCKVDYIRRKAGSDGERVDSLLSFKSDYSFEGAGNFSFEH